MSTSAQAVHGRRESVAWEASYFRTRRSRWLRRRRLAFFAFRPEERILEVGCGDGLNLEILWAQGIRNLVGCDISLPLLARVRAGPAVAGDLFALPVAGGALDAVLADSVLHHLTTVAPTLAEIRRVLRPGGRLCLLEPRPSAPRRLMDAAMDRVTFPPPLRARQLTYLEERNTYHAWLRYVPRLAEDLRAASLEPVRRRDLVFGLALECHRIA